MENKIKYNQLVIMKVIEHSDILVIAMSDSKKLIKVLPNNRFSVNCFYHDDHKPSMVLDRKNNRFYCHSCKKAGNVISLFMQIYNLDFLTSLETLANLFDIKIPKRGYTNVKYDLVNRMKNIKDSSEYRELLQKSYEKTLKK